MLIEKLLCARFPKCVLLLLLLLLFKSIASIRRLARDRYMCIHVNRVIYSRRNTINYTHDTTMDTYLYMRYLYVVIYASSDEIYVEITTDLYV